MAEFAYNNAENISNGYISFELNYDFYTMFAYKEDVNRYSKSKNAKQLATELQTLISVYRKNLHYAQEF